MSVTGIKIGRFDSVSRVVLEEVPYEEPVQKVTDKERVYGEKSLREDYRTQTKILR